MGWVGNHVTQFENKCSEWPETYSKAIKTTSSKLFYRSQSNDQNVTAHNSMTPVTESGIQTRDLLR